MRVFVFQTSRLLEPGKTVIVLKITLSLNFIIIINNIITSVIIILFVIIYLTSRSIQGSKDFIVQLPESRPAKLKVVQML